jgi:hypothetical protein
MQDLVQKQKLIVTKRDGIILNSLIVERQIIMNANCFVMLNITNIEYFQRTHSGKDVSRAYHWACILQQAIFHHLRSNSQANLPTFCFGAGQLI